MTTTNDWKTRLATLALSTSLIASAASVDAATGAAGGNPLDGNWHFTLTPYLWLPNFNGTADVRLPGAFDRLSGAVEELRLDAEVGPNDYLENLQFALMLTGEARKGRWSALTDFIYVDFGDQKTHARSLSGPRGRVVDTVDRELETSFELHRLDPRRGLHRGIRPELARRPARRLPLSRYGLGAQMGNQG